MKILKKEKDIAKKWRALVQVSDTDAKFIKFDHEPTDEEALAEAEIIVAKEVEATQTAVDIINAQIAELEAKRNTLI